MGGALTTTLVVASLLLTAAALGQVVRDRPVGRGLLAGAALVELGLLAQLVVTAAALIGGERPAQSGGLPTFLGYLLTVVLLLPAGVLWSLTERTRWGSAVLAGAAVTVPVMIARMLQVWDGTGG